MDIERRLDELGLTLPPPAALPQGVEIPFAWIHVQGNRAYILGDGVLAEDASPAGPFGKVPSEVTLQEAQHSARLATLAILASLKATLGDLEPARHRLAHGQRLRQRRTRLRTDHRRDEPVLSAHHRPVRNRHRQPRPHRPGAATVPLNLPVVVSAEVEIAPTKPLKDFESGNCLVIRR